MSLIWVNVNLGAGTGNYSRCFGGDQRLSCSEAIWYSETSAQTPSPQSGNVLLLVHLGVQSSYDVGLHLFLLFHYASFLFAG